MKLTFPIYAHTEHDEEAREEAEEITSGSGVDADIIEEFLETNPLYEIEFQVEYDTESNKFTILSCKSTFHSWKLTK